MSTKVYTIPSSAPFADTLAKGLIARVGADPLALADTIIYLPTRRAQRSFGEAFARHMKAGAALLPQFKALGEVDEDELLFEPDVLDLPPAIAPMRRTLLLASLVRRWRGEEIGFAQAAALADGLAQVMDEADTQGVDLSQLDGLVPGALAAHWERVREFLRILEAEWPKILEAEGAIAPARRRNLALQALAKRVTDDPPAGPVIAAGSTGSIPATAELLKAIAELPNGSVVLPGLDRDLDRESWLAIDDNPGHPQFGLKQLLKRLGVAREDVRDWVPAPNAARERTLREALRPAPTTDAWRALIDDKQQDAIAQGAAGIELVEAADPSEEASAIALVLREALETKDTTATLVTPDRALARRVAAELRRWEIEVDDSAGQPLSHTPPGTLLCLLAEAANAAFAPVELLALLKHPLCTLRQDAGEFRARARELDRLLRGPRPDSGLDGISTAIARKRDGATGESIRNRLAALGDWFTEVADTLRPLETALSKREASLTDIIAAHRDTTDALAGDAWRRAEAGEAAFKFVETLMEAAAAIPPIGPGAYASLFRRLSERIAVRRSRSGHSRISILGPLEARLLSFDTIVLGGLNEGSWPRNVGADPWFSRPMRKTLGLEQPERAIGQAAHDFATLAAAPHVVLTRARKADGVPAVASRWVQRLTQLTDGLGLKKALAPRAPYLEWAQALRDAGAAERIKMPRPTPPVEARPKQLPVTDIETWVRDPYAIYAKRVLRLRVLDPLDAEVGPLERGSAVHLALERFVKQFPGALPHDAAIKLCEIADRVFAEQGTPRAVLALWRPRFARAAEWLVERDRELRTNFESALTEVDGTMTVTPQFKLYGRADRIDLRAGGKAAILDYKTGALPTKKQIESFLAPQLLLEAAMLDAGAFPGADKRETEALLYVQVSGGRVAGAMLEVDVGLVGETMAKLKRRIADFARPSASYDPRLHPKQASIAGDYDHLSRVREWSIGGWEAPEE